MILIDQLDLKLHPLRSAIKTNEQDREAARQKNAQSEQTLQDSLSGLQRDANSLQTLREEVEMYEREASKRESIQKSLAGAKREADELKKQISDLQSDIATKQARLNESEAVHTDIKANLEYRQRIRDLSKHQELISEKKAVLKEVTRGDDLFLQIGDMDGTIQKVRDPLSHRSPLPRVRFPPSSVVN